MLNKIVFRIGGIGNQYFQQLYANDINAYNCDVFYNKIIYKILGWTFHDNKSMNLIGKSKKYPLLNIFLLFLDLFLIKFLNFSLFTNFDLRTIKCVSVFKNYNNIGYYQIARIKQPTNILSNNLFDKSICDLNVIHVRGGDLKSEFLGNQYYKDNLILGKEFYLVTDDKEFASSNLDFDFNTFNKESLISDAKLIYNSSVIISSSSTFSLMLIMENFNSKKMVVFPLKLKPLFDKQFLNENSKKLFFR